ncbi:COX15/CtaA family protein [Paenarthrobacter sp. DKR-5]|uniref:COX15/CtaA family protein n=1 Tax=Paenarthrobacter sp. DKR-5 TaxID=2835535 RepID=UPI0027DDF262|nr:COX15/CtaA family protein [Paenarthrobacter sp. DKR-5]
MRVVQERSELKQGFGRRITSRLPREVNPTIRRLAVASLIGQTVLVVTGGAVRLTASGLGCPTWPRCTPDSLVNTPEMGIHGIVEFSNRTLTFLLTAVAVAMLVVLWNLRKERRDLFGLAIGLLASIPAQAVIGGFSVLTGLNPWVVGLHFLVSMALVALSMLLVNRAYGRTGRFAVLPARPVGRTLRQLLAAAGVFSVLAVMLGVVVTGSGPHAGDAHAPRNGLDPDLITRVHVAPVYLLVIASAVSLYLAWRRGRGDQLRTAVVLLVAIVLVQGAIGYTQHFTGLPVVLVGMHMLGASLLVIAATNAVDIAYRKA